MVSFLLGSARVRAFSRLRHASRQMWAHLRRRVCVGWVDYLPGVLWSWGRFSTIIPVLIILDEKIPFGSETPCLGLRVGGV